MRFVFFSCLAAFCLPCVHAADRPIASPSSLSGRVVTETGSPHYAQVRVFQKTIRDGHTELSPRCDTFAEDRGQFQCTGLNAGQYLIQVRPLDQPVEHPISDAVKPKDKSSVLMFYPAATDLNDAIPLDLRAGQQTFVDLRLPSLTGVTVSGSTQYIPDDANLILEATDNHIEVDTQLPINQNLGQKTFAIKRVPPGHYALEANWTVKGVVHRSRLEVTVATANVTNVQLREEPLVAIKGVIAGDSEGRVKGLLLYRCDDGLPQMFSPVVNSSFSFPRVPVGEYFVALPVGTGAYIGTVTIGNARTQYQRLHIDANTEDHQVVLEIAAPAAMLKGTVKEWNEASKAQVAAVSVDTGQVYARSINSSGDYSFGDLPPGGYRVSVWLGVDTTPYRDPAFLRSHERDGVSVTVGNGDTVVVGPLPVS